MSHHEGRAALKNTPSLAILLLLPFLFLTACSAQADVAKNGGEEEATPVWSDSLILPEMDAIPAGGAPVRIVATTGIVGDVVSNIAGDNVILTVLMAPDQDPHGYQSTAGDLRKAAEADVIFVNGWGLEEGLLDDLSNAAGSTPLVPVSAGLKPRLFDGGSGMGTQGGDELRIDPHVWLAPANALTWVKNIETILSDLDPDNATAYAERARAYESELVALGDYYEQSLALVARSDRVLVTNHDAFGYFADAYGFTIVGTILPGDSTLSEPSSRDLASLLQSMREAQLCSIFVERSASQRLAEQLAGELDHCEEVKIVPLYSGALGPEGSGAETYLKMMRENVDHIVDSLARGETDLNSESGRT